MVGRIDLRYQQTSQQLTFKDTHRHGNYRFTMGDTDFHHIAERLIKPGLIRIVMLSMCLRHWAALRSRAHRRKYRLLILFGEIR